MAGPGCRVLCQLLFYSYSPYSSHYIVSVNIMKIGRGQAVSLSVLFPLKTELLKYVTTYDNRHIRQKEIIFERVHAEIMGMNSDNL